VQSTTTGCGFTTTPRAYDDATPALKSVLARKRGLVDEYRQSESSSTHTARLDASANVRRTSERSPSSTSFRTCTEAGRERRSGRPLYIVVVERISRGKFRGPVRFRPKRVSRGRSFVRRKPAPFDPTTPSSRPAFTKTTTTSRSSVGRRTKKGASAFCGTIRPFRVGRAFADRRTVPVVCSTVLFFSTVLRSICCSVRSETNVRLARPLPAAPK